MCATGPDAGLAGDGVRALAREGKRPAAKLGGTETKIRDRSRAVGKRLAGEPIEDRLVSIFDPDARPLRNGKPGKPTELG